MFDFINKLGSTVSVRLTGTNTEQLLNMCACSGIELMSVEPLGEYSCRIIVPGRRLQDIHTMAARSMCSIEEERVGGAAAAGASMRRRLLPLLLCLILISFLIVSKVFIWEVEVKGNETVATGEILAALKDCGVEQGSFWPAFSSDNIRSEVVAVLPELLWLTVNVRGSRAEVVVRERTAKPEMIDPKNAVDIISKKDAFITEINVLHGASVVKKGQVVRSGDLLISGAVESLTGSLRMEHAYGEVKGQTYYELTAVDPLSKADKVYTGDKQKRWALEFWGRRVNFYRNSSIYADTCDKIRTEYKLQMEGVFSLPVSVICEELVYYETGAAQVDERQAKAELEQQLYEALLLEIGDGEILSQSCAFSRQKGMLTACLKAVCEESIGETVPVDEFRLQRNNNKNTEEGT